MAFFRIFVIGIEKYMDMSSINRIRIILDKQNKTNIWLSYQLGKSETTIDNYVRLRLYTMNLIVLLQQCINLLLEYSKDKTTIWLQGCATKFTL